MSTREFTDFSRIRPYRDAKSIVIATEGELTERIYFEDLAHYEGIQHPSVEIKVLPTSEGLSAPVHVLKRLDNIRRQYRMYEGDELWLVIDVDRWNTAQLRMVTQQALQKGYFVAESNPCFEMWLLLHHRSLESYSDAELGVFKGDEDEQLGSKCPRIERELRNVVGNYSKRSLDTNQYLPALESALMNARLSDADPPSRWLNHIGSRVYRLVESIIESSPHNPLN